MMTLRTLPKCTRTGKIAHANQASAQRHLLGLINRNSDGIRHMHCYQCPHCQQWHVGHNSRPR